MEQESALAWGVEEVAQDPEPGLAQAQVLGQVHIPHLHLIPVLALPVVQALALKRAPMPAHMRALVLGQAPGEVEEMVVAMAVVVGTVTVLEGEVGQAMVKAMARAEAMVKVMAAGATTEINLSSYIAEAEI